MCRQQSLQFPGNKTIQDHTRPYLARCGKHGFQIHHNLSQSLQDTPNWPETCMMTRPENRYTVNTHGSRMRFTPPHQTGAVQWLVAPRAWRCSNRKCYIFASAVGGVSVVTLLKNPAERRTLVRCLLDVRERVPMTFQTDNTSNSLAQSTGSRPSGGDGWWVIKVRQMNLPTERQSSR